ncbi:MAG: hypothetical protein Q4Q04_04530 [Methanocorpusculum sp.]|nr:hypothetical protein [Methanocorpusculum sp.]
MRISLLAEPELCKNPPERCYLCKKIIMGRLKELAAELGLDAVFDGTHADDLCGADRPGIAALKELGIVSPLAAAGIGKEEILKIARERNIPAPPASACLATRIPAGSELTAEKLRLVDRAEQALREAGVTGILRVRLTAGRACVEVEPEMLKSAELYEDKLKHMGLENIAVGEYQTGGAQWKKKMQ